MQSTRKRDLQSATTATSTPHRQSSMRGRKRVPKGIVKFYLVLYNLISCLGWCRILSQLVLALLAKTRTAPSADFFNYQLAYTQTSYPLAIIQSTAALEIVHAVLGLVPSTILTNVMQVGTRCMVIWISQGTASSTGHKAYAAMVLAWAFADIFRYLYYLTHLVGLQLYVLNWLRYSLFLILYPIGTGGEVILLYLASLWPQLRPYQTTLQIVLLIYPFGLVYMYSHMLKLRKKNLAKLKARNN